MSNRNKGWEKYVGPWYVYQDNWQHAIKAVRGGYQLPGNLEPFKRLAQAKDEALRRIANAKPQLVRYVQ
jgi:hypothetical protein